jgi:dihydrofolate reductase
MSKIIVWEGVTLDGVMQAPARPDEDRRGGFPYGGWAVPYMDEVIGRFQARGMSGTSGALLLGRRTYEDFYQVWPARADANPYTAVLNKTLKYVASRTLREPLPWVNSQLLKGDVAEAVAGLRAHPGGDIVVLGSGELVQTLMQHHLVDRYVLSIFPLTLGTGRKLFDDGAAYATLRLVESQTSTSGVLLTIYEPVEPVAGPVQST